MRTRELVQDLPQQPHRPRHFAQHSVRVSRILKGPGGMRQPAQPLIGLSSISNRINKRRHPNSPLYVTAVRLRGRCACCDYRGRLNEQLIRRTKTVIWLS